MTDFFFFFFLKGPVRDGMWIGHRVKVLLTPCRLDSALFGVLREDQFLLVSWNTVDENAKDLNLHNLERIRQIFLKPLLQR